MYTGKGRLLKSCVTKTQSNEREFTFDLMEVRADGNLVHGPRGGGGSNRKPTNRIDSITSAYNTRGLGARKERGCPPEDRPTLLRLSQTVEHCMDPMPL